MALPRFSARASRSTLPDIGSRSFYRGTVQQPVLLLISEPELRAAALAGVWADGVEPRSVFDTGRAAARAGMDEELVGELWQGHQATGGYRLLCGGGDAKTRLALASVSVAFRRAKWIAGMARACDVGGWHGPPCDLPRERSSSGLWETLGQQALGISFYHGARLSAGESFLWRSQGVAARPFQPNGKASLEGQGRLRRGLCLRPDGRGLGRRASAVGGQAGRIAVCFGSRNQWSVALTVRPMSRPLPAALTITQG